jgi:dihydroxy-acid dehydratase
MEDLNAAGGLGAVLHELKPLLHLDCLTVTGETLGERLGRAPPPWVSRAAIRPLDDPIEPVGGLVALFGSLAPGGAILKRSAADKSLFERTGRAVVFVSLEDLAARIDDPALDVAPEDFLVLRNAGPRSAVAMPEAGYLPIPRKLAQRGLKDMVRISDARMSGTAFGTVILHVTPEAAVGGPLALVETGDRIRLSVAERRLDLLVDEAVLADRRRRYDAMAAARTTPHRGYDWLYQSHVLQADKGCDFDFLTAAGRPAASRTGTDI